MKSTVGIKIHITGIVQGVGFRPFIFALASKLDLKGWVRNSSAGVEIQLDGYTDVLSKFVHALENELPPLAKIDTIQTESCNAIGFTDFKIIPSEPIPGAYIPISPDVSICSDCRREMLNPNDRRYLYPFINCTNCGPRFTIIKDIPYDRPKTTMSPFSMCDECQSEYLNPLDRRFHAQPVACQACGPHIWIEESSQLDKGTRSVPIQDRIKISDHQYIQTAQEMLLRGKILAIKGLGGFHLACDATNREAIIELRNRKLRVDKPFALMMPDLETVAEHCYLNEKEKELLSSRERPIVLLKRLPNTKIDPSVAPGQNTLGVMLPYTPLHYLLFEDLVHPGNAASRSESPRQVPKVLVMTSGNISEEPIAYLNKDARERLAPLADYFLMNNREIHIRCDDSVVRHLPNSLTNSAGDVPKRHRSVFLRRARGYAPNPLKLPWDAPQILATGSQLKNTFCLTKDNNAFISHHIGDMENFETLQSFDEGIEHFKTLFRISPQAIAADLHPDYLATRYALDQAKDHRIPLYQVQHHHAHIAACMADNGLTGELPILGVSLDGTGYGDDSAIWGGEFLVADYSGYQRFAHLEYSPLPGGDSAIRKPYRIALAQLWHHSFDWNKNLAPVQATCGDELSMLRSMLENNINTPKTSSMGRLFDSVAALVGVREQVNYEAQAAIEFENLADPTEPGRYRFLIKRPQKMKDASNQSPDPIIISPLEVYAEIFYDLEKQISIPTISAKFHNGLAQIILEICKEVRDQYHIHQVALSGGVWQNMTLLKKTIPLLEASDFIVYTHVSIPPNDGGISLGQAAITRFWYQEEINKI